MQPFYGEAVRMFTGHKATSPRKAAITAGALEKMQCSLPAPAEAKST
jgi:hypothetical protein